MTKWTRPQELVELAAFYDLVRREPESISDADFVENIKKASWPTNCWCYVEQQFAIIAPGCAMRPHLVPQLIYGLIDAMICGGLEDPDDIIAQGVACATKVDPYVRPTEEGRQWLLHDWPKYADVAGEVFRKIWLELESDQA